MAVLTVQGLELRVNMQMQLSKRTGGYRGLIARHNDTVDRHGARDDVPLLDMTVV